MMHKAWCSTEIKFQGHTGWLIDDLISIWVRLLGRSQLSNPTDLPCFFRSGICLAVKFVRDPVKMFERSLPNKLGCLLVICCCGIGFDGQFSGTCKFSFGHGGIEGILPKGPYLPCVSMAGRALLAGYLRSMVCHQITLETFVKF